MDNLFDLVGDVGIGNGVLVHHGRFYSHLLVLALVAAAIRLISGRRVA